MSTDTKTKKEDKRNKTKKRRITMYWATWCVLVILFAVSFYLPPMGVIDGSVLRAGCILLAVPLLASLENVITQIKNGQKFKIQHGNTSAEISQNNSEKNT